MNTSSSSGYMKGLYTYYADNNEELKNVFSNFFGLKLSLVKIAFRREDLELMILIKLQNSHPDAVIMFTINRLDEYRFNYDNELLLGEIITTFKVGNRSKKILNIINKIDHK